MFFNTIEEYDAELTEMGSRLYDMEKRFRKYPDRLAIQMNHRGLKQLYDMILKDKEDFLKIMSDNTQLHVSDDENQKFSLPTLSKIFISIKELTEKLSELLKNATDLNVKNVIPVKQVSSGSIHLSFSMGDEKTDLREVKLNYEVFNTLFDMLECEKSELSKLRESLGEDVIEKYLNFLEVLINNDLNCTLENSTRKAGLTHKEALEVYNVLSND